MPAFVCCVLATNGRFTLFYDTGPGSPSTCMGTPVPQWCAGRAVSRRSSPLSSDVPCQSAAHSWGKAISDSGLETPRWSSWVWSKGKVIESDQYPTKSAYCDATTTDVTNNYRCLWVVAWQTKASLVWRFPDKLCECNENHNIYLYITKDVCRLLISCHARTNDEFSYKTETIPIWVALRIYEWVGISCVNPYRQNIIDKPKRHGI